MGTIVVSLYGKRVYNSNKSMRVLASLLVDICSIIFSLLSSSLTSCRFCHFLFLIPCCAGVLCFEYGAGESRTGSVSWVNEVVLIKKSLSESLLGFLPLSFPHSISSITASAFIFPGAISILCSSFAPLYFVILFSPFFFSPFPPVWITKGKRATKS